MNTSRMSTIDGFPADYAERVYAGVLGKMIGVYLGRPFEGWTHARIRAELGEVSYYVHERLGKPLVVTDDDLAGTFAFLRALGDHGNRPDLTAAQIGETWLNYLIEGRTALWWGGLGNSTEHTAYLRLKNGIPAPRSGSIELNGAIVAEQIGAQIFIDGWAMVAPGDPELAASLARRAASVSHDGEAVYAAQVIAAMESVAFVESDLACLIGAATRLIPKDSMIYRLIEDLHEWRQAGPDWQAARARLERQYGYDRFPGNCHVVPNHGVVILSLLYGEDDFQKSLMIANTCGWDTDCNSGNVGCLMGIKNGLAGIEAGPDWRGPLADRLFIPTAEGGGAITDAAREAFFVVNAGRALAGQAPLQPKGGARFHFELPGSVQGFQPELDPHSPARLLVENIPGHSRLGRRSLALRYTGAGPAAPARAGTATFILPEDLEMPGYPLQAAPTLYPGQLVTAGLSADRGNPCPVQARLYLRRYRAGDELELIHGPQQALLPGDSARLSWRLGDPNSGPVAEIGVEIEPQELSAGVVYLDDLGWSGEPRVEFARPAGEGTAWRRAWVEAADRLVVNGPASYRLVQNSGRGLLITGTREWRDYRISATLFPYLAEAVGLAVRVQGLRRCYALLAGAGGRIRLVKVLGEETVLAEQPYPWAYGQALQLELEVDGARLRAWADGQLLFDLEDLAAPLFDGGIALAVEAGCVDCDRVTLRPAGGEH